MNDLEKKVAFAKLSNAQWARPEYPKLTADVEDAPPPNRLRASITFPGLNVPAPYLGREAIRLTLQSDGVPISFPEDAPPPVGEGWPKDTLHDAARRVVGGVKDLVPGARKAVADAVTDASRSPIGRAASDAGLGHAISGRKGW
jgi:hypothetical protein